MIFTPLCAVSDRRSRPGMRHVLAVFGAHRDIWANIIGCNIRRNGSKQHSRAFEAVKQRGLNDFYSDYRRKNKKFLPFCGRTGL